MKFFVSIIAGTSESLHSQTLKMGVFFWDDYFVLRGEEPIVDCDMALDFDKRLAELEIEHEAENSDFDLFSSEFDRSAAINSLNSQLDICKKKIEAKELFQKHESFGLDIFRKFEHGLASISLLAIAQQKLTLILLLAFASLD